MKSSEWFKENIGVILFWLVIGIAIIWWIVASIPPQVTTITPSPVSSTFSSDLDSSGCYSAEKAKNHKNENACVDFNVGYTYESSAGNKFIDQYQNYTSGFIVYIPSSSSARRVDLNQFKDKKIKVSGQIVDYNGATEIIVTDISQIKIYK